MQSRCISRCVWGTTNRYFKPKNDLFLTPTQWFFHPTGPWPQCEPQETLGRPHRAACKTPTLLFLMLLYLVFEESYAHLISPVPGSLWCLQCMQYDPLLSHPDVKTSNLTLGAHNLMHLSASPYRGMERRQGVSRRLCNLPLGLSHVCLPNTITDRQSLRNTFLILLCTSSTSIPFTDVGKPGLSCATAKWIDKRRRGWWNVA